MTKWILSLLLAAVALQHSRSLEAGQIRAGTTVYSTYFGGGAVKSYHTYGEAIAVDKAGFMYVAGRTQAKDFPLVNSAQAKYGGGANDAYVAKLTPDGQRVLFATFIGGGDADWAEDIAVDDEGNVFITGSTYSKNFPTTMKAFKRKFGGGDRDGFVVKLSPQGVVTYATFLGGGGTDRLLSIAVDGIGNAYVTGSTNSKDFTPVRAAGKSSANSNWDVLVAKLDPSGSRLVYSLRFGGTAGKQPPRGQIGGECGTGIAVTRDGGRAYVAGFTDSIDLPIPNATGNPGGYDDGFVAMLDDKGSLVGGAYLAGSGKDSAEGVALDSSGAVYVAGQTASNDFPISPGQPRPNPRAITTLLPAWGFVTKFQAGLTGIVYSGIVFPGTVDIADIAVDNAGWAYAAGGTAYVMVAPSGAIAGRAGLGAPIEARGVAVDTSATLHLTGYIMFGDRSLPLVRALKSDRGEASAQAFITKIDVR